MFSQDFRRGKLASHKTSSSARGHNQPEIQGFNHRRYFESQVHDSDRWWLSMGSPESLRGKRVLDFGCGHGALTLKIAKQGAAWVTGLDLEKPYIAFAQQNLSERFHQLGGNVEFRCEDIADVAGTGGYDCIVSKDTFEHVEGLADVVGHMYRLLKPGGILHVGFSPMFYSPWGDHGLLWYRLPWLSAVFPERLLVKLASKRTGKPITCISDVGLNKLTPVQFRDLFGGRDWRIASIRYNVGDKLLLKPMNLLRSLPGLEKYVTVSIYASIIRL